MKKFILFLMILLATFSVAQNTKISALPSGAPAQSSDLFPIARGGTNYSLSNGNILSFILGQSTNTFTGNMVVNGSLLYGPGISNDGTTGTANKLLAKYTTSGTLVKCAATTDICYPVVSGGGTTGSAYIQSTPGTTVTCTFVNAATAGHFVQADAATGKCSDTGSATAPTSGFIVGIVFGTSCGGGAGDCAIVFLGYNASAGGGDKFRMIECTGTTSNGGACTQAVRYGTAGGAIRVWGTFTGTGTVTNMPTGSGGDNCSCYNASTGAACQAGYSNFGTGTFAAISGVTGSNLFIASCTVYP